MMLLASFIAALIPTVIYVTVLSWFDRYEKEPFWLMALTFLWGAIPAIVLALVGEIIFQIPIEVFVTGSGQDLIAAAVGAPLIEEFFKAIPVLLIFVLYRREFDGVMDGLLYGALAGFGFSMTENMFYFYGAYSESGAGAFAFLVFLRAVIFGLNHALFSSVFGASLGYARNTRNRAMVGVAPLLGLAGAMFLHMIHNLFASLAAEQGVALLCIPFLSAWTGVLAWLGLMVWATRREKRMISEELAEEVASGLLPEAYALAAGSYRTRLRNRWAALQARGIGQSNYLNRLHLTAAELAFKKRQYRIHGDKFGAGAEIQKLRERLHTMMVQGK